MGRIVKMVMIMTLILGFQACSDSDDRVTEEPFVGSWTILGAKKDGVSSDQWKGLRIDFKQTDFGRGFYSLVDSPDESIWKSCGVWFKLDSIDAFRRDEMVNIIYSRTNDNLQLSFLIISNESTCVGSVCLPVVLGQWLFDTKKN